MEKYVICWAATPWAVSWCQALAAGEEANSRRGGGCEGFTTMVVVARELKCNWPSQEHHVWSASTGSSVQCTWQWLDYFAKHFPPTAMHLLDIFPWPGMPLPQPASLLLFILYDADRHGHLPEAFFDACLDSIWSPPVSAHKTSALVLFQSPFVQQI